jgi:hypothetical protein
MRAALRRQRHYATALRELGDDDWMVRKDAAHHLRRGGREALPWIRRGLHSEDSRVKAQAENLFEQVNHFADGYELIREALAHYKVLFVNPAFFGPEEQQLAALFFQEQWGHKVTRADARTLIRLIDRKYRAWSASITPPIPYFLQRELAVLKREIDEYLTFEPPATPQTAESEAEALVT